MFLCALKSYIPELHNNVINSQPIHVFNSFCSHDSTWSAGIHACNVRVECACACLFACVCVVVGGFLICFFVASCLCDWVCA